MPRQYVTRSVLAKPLDPMRLDVTRRPEAAPWGVVVHTTGAGVPARAAREGKSTMEVAVAVYMAPDNPSEGVFTPFPHYVIDGAGTIVQICDESLRARHVGLTPADRESYLSGEWLNHVTAAVATLWRERWPTAKSPAHLYPGPSPNAVYLGVELIPTATPDLTGGRFTSEQYESLGILLEDVEDRYELRLSGARLVGHEDLSPLTRWDGHGGWDPGSLRERPQFHWGAVRRHDGWAFTETPGAVPQRPQEG